MATERLTFDEPHYQSLELLATQALAGGDPRTAFKLADRRCRIPPEPQAHCFILRGEALHQMGAKDAATRDIETALELAPDDIAANRRMLAWGNENNKNKPQLPLSHMNDNFDGPSQSRSSSSMKRGKTIYATLRFFITRLRDGLYGRKTPRLRFQSQMAPTISQPNRTRSLPSSRRLWTCRQLSHWSARERRKSQSVL